MVAVLAMTTTTITAAITVTITVTMKVLAQKDQALETKLELGHEIEAARATFGDVDGIALGIDPGEEGSEGSE